MFRLYATDCWQHNLGARVRFPSYSNFVVVKSTPDIPEVSTAGNEQASFNPSQKIYIRHGKVRKIYFTRLLFRLFYGIFLLCKVNEGVYILDFREVSPVIAMMSAIVTYASKRFVMSPMD